MEHFFKKELNDYSDEDLLSLVSNPKSIDKNRLSKIVDELQKRGLSEQVAKIENGLIKLNPIYSKFWNRFGAYLIDIIILAFIGFILGLFFKDKFVQMGNQSILVGFFISVIYFGLLNSKIFNGQTFGKKVLKIKVVNSNFNSLSIQKSTLRALIYTVPYFFLNYTLPGFTEFSFLSIVIGVVFLTILIILPVHFILNTPTRQAIHDLILNTYVIEIDAYPRQELVKSRLMPLYISGVFILLIFGISIFFNLKNKASNYAVHELTSLTEQIDKIDKVGSSSITRSTNSTKKLGSDEIISKTDFLKVNIFLREDLILNLNPEMIEDLSFVQDALKIILKNYSDLNRLDLIHINLIYGYNIGIYKSSHSVGFSNTIDYWKQTLK